MLYVNRAVECIWFYKVKEAGDRKGMLKKQLFIVFVVEHYNPLGMIRSLGEHGIRPVAIVLRGKYRLTSKSRYISQLHMVDTIEEGYHILISQYGGTGGTKPFVLTANDQITSFLDLRFDELKDRFYFFNAGSAGRVTYFMNKEHIGRLAVKHGLNVLRIFVVNRGEIPEEIEYPVITKAIISTIPSWKDNVFICHSEEELKAAYAQMEIETVLLQKYIVKKNELCMEGFSASKGSKMFIAIASGYDYLLADRYSPYMTIRNFNNQELQEKLRAMLMEIGFEGIYEIEFLVAEDNTLYFSEINFRNSTWSYAATKAGMPLPVLWAEGMTDETVFETCYKVIPDGFHAMVEIADFIERVRGKKTGLCQWIMDLVKCRCLYYFNIRDLMPVISMMWGRIKYLHRRKRERV